MRTGNMKRPQPAGSELWNATSRAGQALAATMLVLVKGPAHGALPEQQPTQ
jgi:hypothetical protein